MANKKLLILIFAGIFLILVLFENVSGFAGGTGTLANPYQISTCQELQDMNLNLKANYSLISNVDCSVTNGWNSGEGFEPIGDPANGYNGHFNGNGFDFLAQ